MSEDIEWSILPDLIWENILNCLNGENLLRATEACPKFADIFAQSSKLTAKIKMKMYTNDDPASQLQTLMHSKRKYRNLLIDSRRIYSGADQTFFDVTQIEMIRKLFGKSLTKLELVNTTASSVDIAEILTSFVNLKSLSLNSVYMNDHGDYYYEFQLSDDDRRLLKKYKFSFEQLSYLNINSVEFFCFYFFEDARNLRNLIVYNLTLAIDVDYFENFLLRLKDLKVLELNTFRDNFIIQSSLFSKPPFQLETLMLHAVYWTENERATAFFQSQYSLRTVKLMLKNRHCKNLDELMFFNDMLKYIFMLNRDLHVVEISSLASYPYNIRNCDFLEGIVCPKVETLIFSKGHEEDDAVLMRAFTKMFPNLKELNLSINSDVRCQDERLISSWIHLEKLNLTTSDVSLKDVQVCSPSFVDLTLMPCSKYRTPDHLVWDKLNEFLGRHSAVRRFELNCLGFKPVSEYLAKIITNNLTALESLSLDFCSLKPRAAKILCWKAKNLKSIRITYQSRLQSSYEEQIRKVCQKYSVDLEFVDMSELYNRL